MQDYEIGKFQIIHGLQKLILKVSDWVTLHPPPSCNPNRRIHIKHKHLAFPLLSKLH